MAKIIRYKGERYVKVDDLSRKLVSNKEAQIVSSLATKNYQRAKAIADRLVGYAENIDHNMRTFLNIHNVAEDGSRGAQAIDPFNVKEVNRFHSSLTQIENIVKDFTSKLGKGY